MNKTTENTICILLIFSLSTKKTNNKANIISLLNDNELRIATDNS